MTEREDSSEGFLERWSRRKTEAQRDAGEQPDAVAPADPSTGAATRASDPSEGGRQPPAAAPETPAFDIASLPSIESITATTDIRAFLAPGVPAELTRAALRRAWAADPAIRDFRGLQENDWDFNDPNGVPGFGRFAPGEDIKKLIAQVFNEAGPETGQAEPVELAAKAEAQSEPTVGPSEEAIPARKIAEVNVAASTSIEHEASIVRRNSVAASQDSNAEVGPEQPPLPRKHGRALPE